MQGDDQPIGDRKSHERAGLAERELTGPWGLSKFACDWRSAMATTQRSAPITLPVTDKAAVEVRKFMAEERVPPEPAGLRIGVLPGGCSGFKYSLSIEDKPADDDMVIESAGVRCFVDGFSAQYLNGVTLDYKSNFQESGFAFENPHAPGGYASASSVA